MSSRQTEHHGSITEYGYTVRTRTQKPKRVYRDVTHQDFVDVELVRYDHATGSCFHGGGRHHFFQFFVFERFAVVFERRLDALATDHASPIRIQGPECAQQFGRGRRLIPVIIGTLKHCVETLTVHYGSGFRTFTIKPFGNRSCTINPKSLTPT